MSAMKPAPRMATLVGGTTGTSGPSLSHSVARRRDPADKCGERPAGRHAIDVRVEIRLDVHIEPVVDEHVEPGALGRDVESQSAARRCRSGTTGVRCRFRRSARRREAPDLIHFSPDWRSFIERRQAEATDPGARSSTYTRPRGSAVSSQVTDGVSAASASEASRRIAVIVRSLSGSPQILTDFHIASPLSGPCRRDRKGGA